MGDISERARYDNLEAGTNTQIRINVLELLLSEAGVRDFSKYFSDLEVGLRESPEIIAQTEQFIAMSKIREREILARKAAIDIVSERAAKIVESALQTYPKYSSGFQYTDRNDDKTWKELAKDGIRQQVFNHAHQPVEAVANAYWSAAITGMDLFIQRPKPPMFGKIRTDWQASFVVTHTLGWGEGDSGNVIFRNNQKPDTVTYYPTLRIRQQVNR